MKRLLVLLLLFSPFISPAQKQGQDAIDSMLKKLPAAREDTNQVKLLNALSFTYGYINPDNGIKYGQQALELATKLDWKPGIGRAYNCLGVNCYGKADNAQALTYYSKSISAYEAADNQKMTAVVLSNMGGIYADQCNYTKALECLFKSLKITEQTGDKASEKNSLSVIGDVYFQESDYPMALEYYFKSLKISEEAGDKGGIAANLNGIGNVFVAQKDYSKALEYYNKDLGIVEETGNRRGIADVNTNIGGVYASQKDHVKALKYFFIALKIDEEIGQKRDEAIVSMNIGGSYASLKNYTLATAYEEYGLKIAKEIGDKYVIVHCLLSLSDTYLGIVKEPAVLQKVKMSGEDDPDLRQVPMSSMPNGKPALLKAATGQLQSGLAMAKEISTLDLIQSCYEHLADAGKLAGNYKQAMAYADSGRAIRDSLFSKENKIKISNLETKRDLDLKQKQIEVDKLDLAKKRNERGFFLFAILLLIVIGVLLINRQKLEKKKAVEETKNADSQRHIAEKDKERATHLLNERIKELAAIYMVNNILLDESKRIPDIFNEIVNLLPSGWQYPDVCAGRIMFDGNEYITSNFALSSFKQEAPINTQDGRSGLIEVIYTREMPNEVEGPFLKEERELINTLANIIEVYFNKKGHKDALVQSEANLKTIFDTTDTGYVLVDKKLKIIASNKFATDFAINEIGLTGGVGDHLTNFFLDERRPVIENLIPEVFDGKSFNYDASYPQPDGSMHWYNIRLTPISGVENRVLGLMVAIDNITDRKNAEEALRKSEANLKSIFDTTHVSYLLLDEHLTVLACNQHIMNWYGKFTGITLRVGGNFLDQARPERRESVKKMYGDVVATSIPAEYETVYTNGKEAMYLTVTVSPIVSNGKTIGLCITGHDITNSKLIEVERQKMITDLLQRNRDLEQFSHIVSHNIRGPLATILGLNNMLKDERNIDDQDFILEGIRVSSEKMDNVVKDLNEILQIRRELSESKIQVSFQEIIDEIKGSLVQLIKENNVKFICDFTAAREILTVRSYINSIFYNLITNSIKYAQPGLSPEINIRTERVNGTIIIWFKDNGIGIDLNRYKDRVFMLYSRFNHTVEGKGLGLFMTKTQVEVLNGTIGIESEPGQGTTFKIVFQG